ncbi:hypothetical protein [Thalassotalea atypica]|uniref:hypothetical protein n=1 Tax=Thalassotalea atypica TaxID=2054316 RepID=UPI0025736588|nr:hypothetical protein [Thalassotalea atypica]
MATLLLCSQTVFSQSTKFAKEISLFSAYVGTWKAEFEVAQGQPSVVDISKWERALNGKALRTLHSINDGEYGGESLIFFDKTKQKIVFYYFTTAEFFTQGVIEVIDDKSFAAYEDVTGNSDGITKVKSISTLQKDKMNVSTSYLKNGQWTTPEQRVYRRTSAKVVFK